MKGNVKLHAWWYAASPLVFVLGTLAICLVLVSLGLEKFMMVLAWVALLAMILDRRVLQSRKLKDLYMSGDIGLFRSFVRHAGANYPTSGLYLLGECTAGEYGVVIHQCEKNLQRHKNNRRLGYQQLNFLAYCYFDLNDCEQLAKVCEQFRHRLEADGNPERIARAYGVFDFYEAYVSRDADRARSVLEHAPLSKTPMDACRGAFLAARVAQNVYGDKDMARTYYEQVAAGNGDLGFVRIAKRELEAMDAGKERADDLPRILPDPEKPALRNKEYVIWRVVGLSLYTIGVVAMVLAGVYVSGQRRDRKTEREITMALSEHASVSQVDYFEVKIKGEVIDGLFVAELDGQLMIGFTPEGEQGVLYETMCKYSATELQESQPPFRFFTNKGKRRYQCDLQVLQSKQEIPKSALYVATVALDGQDYYVALLSASQIE